MHFVTFALMFALFSSPYINVVCTPVDPHRFLVDIRLLGIQCCSGAYAHIITGFHIVTINSCVDSFKRSALKVHIADQSGTTYTRTIMNIISHPLSNKKGMKRAHNLAVVKLNEDFRPANKFWPMKLLVATRSTPRKNCKLHAMQHDFTIKTLKVDYINGETCGKILTKYGRPKAMRETLLCTGYKRDRCQNEYGFIIVCNNIHLVGIGIDGSSFCGGEAPFVSYDVGYFYKWLVYNQFVQKRTATINGTTSIFNGIVFRYIYIVYCILFIRSNP